MSYILPLSKDYVQPGANGLTVSEESSLQWPEGEHHFSLRGLYYIQVKKTL